MRGRLRKRVWFYGTWTRLVIAAVVAVGFALFIAATGVMYFWRGYWGMGIAFELAFLVMMVILLERGLRLYLDVRKGVRSELQRRNCCPYCEYDLRASTKRCPECGRRISYNVEV